MKIRKIIFIIFIMLGITNIMNISKAYTVSTKDVNVARGKEFNISINVDEDTPLSSGTIKFDSTKIEFVKANQENLHSALSDEGTLKYVYADMTGNGTKKIEFTFKAKKGSSTKIELTDLEFVDVNGNEYMNNSAQGSRLIKVNKNHTLIYIIPSVLILAIIIIVMKKKNKK